MMKRKNIVRGLYECLEEKILSGELKPGSVLPSSRELSAQHGISMMSASRILTLLANAGYVRREKGRGTYVSDCVPAVRNTMVRIGIADTLVYSGDVLNDIVLNSRPKAILNHLKKNGISYRFISYEEVSDRALLRKISAELNGILVTDKYFDPVVLSNFESLSIPVVCYGAEFFRERCPFHQVIMDPMQGLREAVKKVVSRSYSGIVVVREKHNNALWRCKSFLMELNHIGYDMEKVSVVAVDQFAIFSAASCYRLAYSLAGTIKGKLLFSTSDVVSYAMMSGFQDKGVFPGKDFELLSFDNQESIGFCPMKHPMLTAVSASIQEQSVAAADLLLDVVRNPPNYRRLLAVPTELVIRETAFAEKQSLT